MSDTVSSIFEHTQDSMKKAAQHVDSDLLKIRAGKANPVMLEGIMVDYYGNPTPVNQVANISVTDARTISIAPWEKNMISPIERAIMMANLGVNPQNDGETIRIFLPPLTEERRKELVKQMNGDIENGKIALRNIRRDAIEKIKKLQKDGLSEDEAKSGEDQIQKLTDDWVTKLDQMSKEKEKEIMTV